MDEEMTAALLDLAHEKDPRYKREALEALIDINRVYQAEFVGSLAVLNPLLRLAVRDGKEYDRMCLLVEARRGENGLGLMWPPPEPEKFNKVAAMRELMRVRRERAGRAVAISNAKRDEPLVGAKRLQFENERLSRWGRQPEDQLEAARRAAGGSLTKEHTARIREVFWANVDERLSAEEKELGITRK